jgi:hypothetical protein
MKTTKLLLTLVALIATGVTSQGASVYTIGTPIYNPANGHTYFVVSSATWSDSEAFAQTLGGHLVTINDAAENAWVYANLIAPDPNRNAWMGLNAPIYTGPWTWASGEAVTYLNWASGEPNGVGGPPWGANFFPPNSPFGRTPSTWNDAPQSQSVQGIVEVVPEPSSFALGFAGLLSFLARRLRPANQKR